MMVRRDDIRWGGPSIGAAVKKMWAGLLGLATMALLLYAAATAARSAASYF